MDRVGTHRGLYVISTWPLKEEGVFFFHNSFRLKDSVGKETVKL